MSMASGSWDSNDRRDIRDPIEHAVAVTPNDDADVSIDARAIYVGVSGHVYVDLVGGATNIAVKNLAAGMWHPMRVKRVRATSTTATDILVGR